ncbi:MAG TPA: DmsC/YnfH family molybdoenzyme membrane anchor subunit [Planctomycetota bacterium]|nr:DmsC/YnfH family molybdoenzyme membrane anchor subunit [Planctomycetota bacterium]
MIDSALLEKTNTAEPESQAPAFTLLEDLLRDQQRLTAVERFAKSHENHALPLQARYYRDLIPLTKPDPGQQYAFEVDLDACTGCKACVTACHSLNGLDENETWRSVGLIHTQTPNLPMFHMVTTACHHCAHPACLDGCPVKAYDKDEVTGIVKHLDDQCIGCQYCILKCPYDVPKYSQSRGIVRKCDMCSGRLEANEAPACVQACPNTAIKIKIVDTEKIIEATSKNCFLPAAPDADYTHPATQYVAKKKLHPKMVASDAGHISPEHSHLPLVFMLVLTQLSAGAFTWDALLSLTGQAANDTRSILSAAALAAGVVGLNCALLHLGRPLYAFRAFLGFKTSWLSREIIAFSAFLAAASAYVSALYLPLGASASLLTPLSVSAAVFGLLGVFCSMMIYIDTRRVFWSAPLTVSKFGLTTVLLGSTATFTTLIAAGAAEVLNSTADLLLLTISASAFLKMIIEISLLSHLQLAQITPLKKSAVIIAQHSRTAALLRFACGFAACALPIVLSGKMTSSLALPLVSALAVAALTGEFLERYLYFRAVVALKMPGGLL